MSFTAGSIGGEYSHTLSVNEMPRHDHVLALSFNANNLGEKYNVNPYSTCVTSVHKNEPNELTLYRITEIPQIHNGVMTYNRGNNQMHNNISPYLTVYYWQRIA